MPPPFTLDADGATLTVRVTPKASRSALAGVVPLGNGSTALALRIAAPPVDGAANAEVVRFVAKQLGIAKGKVTIVKGETARVKQVRITGDPAVLAATLQALAAG
ncbi:hypothetical protein ASG37_13330 [Sphingomonas sp. Leaf407]|nr:hypothetical protein ASE97_12585 [Sphingomonas sp. Leaf42]KQT27347.1 hypothetical protein ASG37_13330 [Sphingomonas sp. Leaf407]